jgi:acylphosphatase
MKCIKILLKGRVQGVGMRYFIYETAEFYGLNGYVANLENGDVEVVAKGNDSDVDEFLSRIRDGTPYSYVEDVEVSEFSGNFRGFEIL